MRSSSVPKPMMWLVSARLPSDGAGLICAVASVMTSETPSTTTPTTRVAHSEDDDHRGFVVLRAREIEFEAQVDDGHDHAAQVDDA